LSMQIFIPHIQVGQTAGFMLRQHSGLGIAQLLVKSGLAFAGGFLAAKVMFKRQRGRGQISAIFSAPPSGRG
jgi:hypothetical protein